MSIDLNVPFDRIDFARMKENGGAVIHIGNNNIDLTRKGVSPFWEEYAEYCAWKNTEHQREASQVEARDDLMQ